MQPTDKKGELTIVDNPMKPVETFRLSGRAYFSLRHIRSASRFANMASKIEDSYDGKYNEDVYEEHRGYITAGILLAVASLEAHINELYADVADDQARKSWTTLDTLGPAVLSLIKRLWECDIPKSAHYPILDKYQIFLLLAQREGFDKGIQPFQDAQKLIQLRNQLTHYEPEWSILSSDPDMTTVHRFERSLKGKFSLNPLTGPSNAFFPDKCLSHGCVKWAIDTVMQFISDFWNKLGVESRYGSIRDKVFLKV